MPVPLSRLSLSPWRHGVYEHTSRSAADALRSFPQQYVVGPNRGALHHERATADFCRAARASSTISIAPLLRSARTSGNVDGRLPSLVPEPAIGTRLEQRLDDLTVARRTGKHQRRIALLVAQIGGGTACAERAHHLEQTPWEASIKAVLPAEERRSSSAPLPSNGRAASFSPLRSRAAGAWTLAGRQIGRRPPYRAELAPPRRCRGRRRATAPCARDRPRH